MGGAGGAGDGKGFAKATRTGEVSGVTNVPAAVDGSPASKYPSAAQNGRKGTDGGLFNSSN